MNKKHEILHKHWLSRIQKLNKCLSLIEEQNIKEKELIILKDTGSKLQLQSLQIKKNTGYNTIESEILWEQGNIRQVESFIKKAERDLVIANRLKRQAKINADWIKIVFKLLGDVKIEWKNRNNSSIDIKDYSCILDDKYEFNP
jgi:hypothetical protein